MLHSIMACAPLRRSAPQIVLVTDEACAPELEPSRFALIAFNDVLYIPGWFKQQVGAPLCLHCGVWLHCGSRLPEVTLSRATLEPSEGCSSSGC